MSAWKSLSLRNKNYSEFLKLRESTEHEYWRPDDEWLNSQHLAILS